MEPQDTLPDGPRLHLGCGSRVVDGWVNMDNSLSARLARFPGLLPLARALRLAPPPPPGGWPRGIRHADIRRRLPHADGTVAAVYHSHVLEHLEEPEARRLLGECARVLAPTGLLRLVVPDARPMLEGYLQAPPSPPGAPPPLDVLSHDLLLFPGREEPDASRLGRLYLRLRRKHLHKWLYDHDSLEHRLREAGFSRIHRCQMGESQLEDIDQFEADYPYPCSVFLDAFR